MMTVFDHPDVFDCSYNMRLIDIPYVLNALFY